MIWVSFFYDIHIKLPYWMSVRPPLKIKYYVKYYIKTWKIILVVLEIW